MAIKGNGIPTVDFSGPLSLSVANLISTPAWNWYLYLKTAIAVGEPNIFLKRTAMSLKEKGRCKVRRKKECGREKEDIQGLIGTLLRINDFLLRQRSDKDRERPPFMKISFPTP